RDRVRDAGLVVVPRGRGRGEHEQCGGENEEDQALHGVASLRIGGSMPLPTTEEANPLQIDFVRLAVTLARLVGLTEQTSITRRSEMNVYVQTNEKNENRIVAFERDADGTLNELGSYSTGGAGDSVAHLTSQGSVTITREGRHLLVTNAGSGDVSLFDIS